MRKPKRHYREREKMKKDGTRVKEEEEGQRHNEKGRSYIQKENISAFYPNTLSLFHIE